MKRRLLISLAWIIGVIGSIAAFIFLPYYSIVYYSSPQTYAGMSKGAIWIVGLICLAIVVVFLILLVKILVLIWTWVEWVRTGVWGEGRPKGNMDYPDQDIPNFENKWPTP